MLKKREDLIKHLKEKCRQCISDKKLMAMHCDMMETMYQIPKAMSADLFMLVADYESVEDFILFAEANVLDISLGGRTVAAYFTEHEISTYCKKKYERPVVKFPITLQMRQVTDDQWIGTITLKELMSFRDAGLIYYNENTQRSMQRKTAKGTEYYTITVYKNKVNQIKEAMLNEQYIPDAITLNMPEETVYSFNGTELIIESIPAFDILDGYHRYVAQSQISVVNDQFDMVMELRITRFDESKAKQFIWQQDQHTKMKKADANSLKQDMESNKIVANIMNDNSFCMYGLIKRNGGVINEADLSAAINLCFYELRSSMTPQQKLAKRISIQKQIKQSIEALVENDLSLLDTPWEFRYLLCVMICISQQIDCDKAKAMSDTLDKKLNASTANRRMVNTIREKMNV